MSVSDSGRPTCRPPPTAGSPIASVLPKCRVVPKASGALATAAVAAASTSSAPPPAPLPPAPVEASKAMTAMVPVGQVSVFPSGYGFVVLTAIGSVMLVTWKSIKVGLARQQHKIPYPALYSPDNMEFNCIQRAHQNTMENLPQFLALLLIGGLEMPYFCTLGGIIWIMGRVAYAKGYYTGNPKKRAKGAFGIIGMLILLAATTKFAFRHLRG